ncbi:putative reverse transcriptase domain-containing protein [Tanacetum coccineum]
MSADSAVTYTSVHSEARSWSIPSEDPYEEAARQLLEQAPHSPEYVPADHVPVYIPEPEHPEDLVPAEDEAPTPLLPPSFLAPRIRPLSPRALEIGESSAAAAARQPGPTIETRLLDTERRIMTLSCEKLRLGNEERETLLMEGEYSEPVRNLASVQAADDLAVQYIMRTQALEARARVDTLEDTGTIQGINLIKELLLHGLMQKQAGLGMAYNSNGVRSRRIETEMWNLKVKGTECGGPIVDYSATSFVGVPGMFRRGQDKIEKYIGGLPDMILGSVKASKSKTMIVGDVRANANNFINNNNNRNNNNNNNNCNNNNNNQQGNGCFECGAQGHFKRNCPRLRNNDRGNQAGNDRAPAKVYVVGNAGANPDNVVAGTFLLNNRYAYILFDTGADRSFVSTSFSSQIDITPSTLDHYYDVELADGRIIGLNTILKGCTLNFLNHQFHINLMPVELGSFDAIIGMDWLAKYQAVIVCAEKIVRIPWRNKTLIIQGDGSTQGNVTRLNIISCTKAQKYMERGFPIFLAHVTAKEVEDKSEKKRLEDVPIVQDFPKVFPEDLPGLPPTRQVEFCTVSN